LRHGHSLISAIFLELITRQFKRVESVQQEIQLTDPSNSKLAVEVMPANGRFYSLVWFDDNDKEDFPKLSADEDSMLINTVRVKVERSDDSSFHAYLLKFARANTPTQAEANAEKINRCYSKDSVFTWLMVCHHQREQLESAVMARLKSLQANRSIKNRQQL
jgi:phage shock protein C